MFSRALLVLAAVCQLVAAQTCARSYTVQPGDICDSISAAQNASTYQLAAANDNDINADCSDLVPGETICLGFEGEDCSTTYVVQLGDDCYDIADNYGLNLTILYGNNPQVNSDCTNLYVGEVLAVCSAVAAPPVPSGSPLPTAIPATATPAQTDLPWCD